MLSILIEAFIIHLILLKHLIFQFHYFIFFDIHMEIKMAQLRILHSRCFAFSSSYYCLCNTNRFLKRQVSQLTTEVSKKRTNHNDRGKIWEATGTIASQSLKLNKIDLVPIKLHAHLFGEGSSTAQQLVSMPDDVDGIVNKIDLPQLHGNNLLDHFNKIAQEQFRW